jgi:hypothetical protein
MGADDRDDSNVKRSVAKPARRGKKGRYVLLSFFSGFPPFFFFFLFVSLT